LGQHQVRASGNKLQLQIDPKSAPKLNELVRMVAKKNKSTANTNKEIVEHGLKKIRFDCLENRILSGCR
jgi:hypothetical protein